uniref:Uncharacterized protein n=2 Tax=gambiae species complex TaxID=44542 RepID=A0A8W7PA57_ANOCL
MLYRDSRTAPECYSADYHDDIRQEQMWEMQALNSQNATCNLGSAHDNTLNGGNGLTANGMSISSSGSSCSTGSTGSTTNGTMPTNGGPLSNGTGLNGVVSAAQVVPNGVAGLGTGTNPSASVPGVGSELSTNGSTQPSSVVSELQHVTSSLTVTIPTSDLEAQTLAFVESANAFLHPALRGVKAVSLARKRPLLGGPRSTMNPTKRTVMTLIARARTAQALHGSRTAQPIGDFY